MTRLAALLLAMLAPVGPALAEDCRPLPELLVEAELHRGEVLALAWERHDGSVGVILQNRATGSHTAAIVREGAEIDQACSIRRTVRHEP